jgi:hypothetical protein
MQNPSHNFIRNFAPTSHYCTEGVCACVVTESDDVPAPINVNGERAGYISHTQVHGLNTGDVDIGSVSFCILSLGLCALYTEEWFFAELEVGKILADEFLDNGLRSVAKATMPEINLIRRFLRDFVYHCSVM